MKTAELSSYCRDLSLFTEEFSEPCLTLLAPALSGGQDLGRRQEP